MNHKYMCNDCLENFQVSLEGNFRKLEGRRVKYCPKCGDILYRKWCARCKNRAKNLIGFLSARISVSPSFFESCPYCGGKVSLVKS